VTFYNGVMVELRKVTWPDIAQVKNATIAIIIFVVVIAAVISILDAVLKGLLISLIPSLFQGGK
jgi:preprotein translocase SecE subunit